MIAFLQWQVISCWDQHSCVNLNVSLSTERCYKLRLKPRCRLPTLLILGQRSTVWGSASVKWRARCHVLAPHHCPKRWRENTVLGWQHLRTEKFRRTAVFLDTYWTLLMELWSFLWYCRSLWKDWNFAPCWSSKMLQTCYFSKFG